jgi:hypothetical protein
VLVDSNPGRLIGALIGLGLFCIAFTSFLGFFIISFHKIQYPVSTSFVSTEGKIVGHVGEYGTTSGGRFGSSSAQAIVPRYRYQVDGVEYESTRVSTFQNRSKDYSSQYPINGIHTVWYDPINPASAVLDKTGRLYIWYAAFALIAVWLTSAFLLRSTLRDIRAASSISDR